MGFRHLFTFTIKALTYTYVPAGLAHFTQSASIVWNRETQRSLVRGCGTSKSSMDGKTVIWKSKHLNPQNIWASLWENLSSGLPTKWDSNQSAQLQKLARKLTFRLQQVYIWYFSNKQITKALIRLPLLYANNLRQIFSRRGPYVISKLDGRSSESCEGNRKDN